MVMRSFLVSLAISLSLHAQEASNLRSWVKAATIIHVRIDGLYTQVPVTDLTNAMDLKKYLRKRERILTEHQIIKPYWKRWWTLWLTHGYGAPLKNDEIIKQVMSAHNTDQFEMHDARTVHQNGKLSLK